MIVRRIRGMSELSKCMEISIATSSKYGIPEFGIDMKVSRDSVRALAGGSFFRVLEHKEEIVGWIAATVTKPALYSAKVALILDYYHCTLRGFYAIDALLSAHESMEISAINTKSVSLVITSPCPHTPKAFNKALVKVGWKDYGYMLLKEVK